MITHINGKPRIEQPPVAPLVNSAAPAWFGVLTVSLALFAGPAVLALVIGAIYLAAVVAGGCFSLFKSMGA